MAVDAQSAIDTLEEAMAQGVRSVTYADGRKVEYAGVAEMQSAVEAFRAKLRVSAGRRSVRASVGAFYRG